jgi:hypothetical protein
MGARAWALMALLLSAAPESATAQIERSPLPGCLQSYLTDAVKLSTDDRALRATKRRLENVR